MPKKAQDYNLFLEDIIAAIQKIERYVKKTWQLMLLYEIWKL